MKDLFENDGMDEYYQDDDGDGAGAIVLIVAVGLAPIIGNAVLMWVY